jgi:hypothetical protein
MSLCFCYLSIDGFNNRAGKESDYMSLVMMKKAVFDIRRGVNYWVRRGLALDSNLASLDPVLENQMCILEEY